MKIIVVGLVVVSVTGCRLATQKVNSASDFASPTPAEKVPTGDENGSVGIGREVKSPMIYQRPRTIVDSAEGSGTVDPQSRHASGVNRVSNTSQLDVRNSVIGAYDLATNQNVLAAV